MRAGEQAGPGDGAKHDAGHHRPQPLAQPAERRAGEQLPKIGDQRRDQQQGGRLRRRHRYRQQPHRHGREPHADDTLDEAGGKEDRADPGDDADAQHESFFRSAGSISHATACPPHHHHRVRVLQALLHGGRGQPSPRNRAGRAPLAPWQARQPRSQARSPRFQVCRVLAGLSPFRSSRISIAKDLTDMPAAHNVEVAQSAFACTEG